MLNYHRERFRKLTFRALALRQSEKLEIHRQTWLAYEMIIQTKNRADLVSLKTPSISYTNKTNDSSIFELMRKKAH